MRLETKITQLLYEQSLSLGEIAEKMNLEEKKVYRALILLHKRRRITHFRDVDGVRRYRPVEENVDSSTPPVPQR